MIYTQAGHTTSLIRDYRSRRPFYFESTAFRPAVPRCSVATLSSTSPSLIWKPASRYSRPRPRRTSQSQCKYSAIPSGLIHIANARRWPCHAPAAMWSYRPIYGMSSLEFRVRHPTPRSKYTKIPIGPVGRGPYLRVARSLRGGRRLGFREGARGYPQNAAFANPHLTDSPSPAPVRRWGSSHSPALRRTWRSSMLGYGEKRIRGGLI